MWAPDSSLLKRTRVAWTLAPTALALFGMHVYLNFTVGYTSSLGARALGWTGLAVAIQACWLLIAPARSRALGALALMAVNLALVLVDGCYFRVFRDVPSVRAIAFSGQGFDVWESVVTVLRPRDLVLLALVMIAVASTAWAARFTAPEPSWPRRLAAATLATLIGAAVLGGALAYGNNFQQDRLGLFKLWNRVEASATVGVLPCHLAELATIYAVAANRPVTPAERDALAAWLRERRPRPVPGRPVVPPGTNVLLIQVEAFQSFALGLKVGGVPVTPTLDAMRRDARTYTRAYAQIAGGGTSDAEFLAATSMYPTSQGGATFGRYGHQRYPTSLASLMRNRGYRTYSMHAFPNPGFWNRTTAYPSLGFTTYVDAIALGPGPKVGLGLGDHEFLLRGLSRLEHGSGPFYASMVTLSSHHPFRRAAALGPPALAVGQEPLLGDYLRAIRYVDDGLGKLFARMRATGLWDRTIVVVYGDHPGFFSYTPGLAALTGASTTSALDARKLWQVPIIIHAPGDPAPGDQAIVAGQVDIMPTVAGWLGVKPPVAFGQDLVTAREGLVGFYDRSAFVGDRYFDGRTRGTWDLRTGRPSAALAKSELARVHDALDGSELVLRGDLLPQLALDGQ